MAQIRQELQQRPGAKLGDIFFALFKRKRTILVFTTIGIIAAAAVYFLYPPSYESQAKLLVRYVLERSGIDPVEAEKASSGANTEADRVIGAEIEILTSWDLAMEVARAIGPQRLFPPPQDRAATADTGPEGRRVAAERNRGRARAAPARHARSSTAAPRSVWAGSCAASISPIAAGSCCRTSPRSTAATASS